MQTRCLRFSLDAVEMHMWLWVMRALLLGLSLGQGCTWIPLDGPLGGPRPKGGEEDTPHTGIDTALVNGEWVGDVVSADVPGLCDGYYRLTITGNLIVSSNTLTDLSDLACVTSVGGHITVYDSDNLTSLSGLDALTSVDGYLDIKYNDDLTSLSGLSALVSMGRDLYIEQNVNLASLSGLDSLTSVGGELYVDNNDALLSLSGLDVLASVGEDVYVYNNTQLCEDDVDALVSQLESFSGSVYTDGNTGPCP